MPDRHIYGFISRLLESIDIAFCLFDAEDRAVMWNDAFLRFFPEHAGHVHYGEPYRENLRRFYEARLSNEERCYIERYIDEGVARHRAQSRPFVFTHRGRRLQVASMPTPGGERARVWQQLQVTAHAPKADGWDAFPIDLLDHIADGAMVLDQADRIIATNAEFRLLYDVPEGRSVIGSTLADVVRAAWEKAGEQDRWSDGFVQDNLNFAGAPFEVELPGGRWRRVIARRSASGIGYFTHSDLTELKRQQAALKRALDELSAIAATDGLTGLANWRRFDAAIKAEWERSARLGTPVALLVIDLDHFKSVNDRFGHAAGDECLRRLAAATTQAVKRSAGLAARTGGEEFAILLPDAGNAESLAVAEEIAQIVRMEAWTEVHPELHALTVSMGICAVRDTTAVSIQDAMGRADAALYRAKNQGRNRIEVDGA
ncbi:diguanylate cyclase [Xanthobacter sp. KR7-65]|uniref:GGDEF domain-containing protein n=1 Tax=Xanthobacter sp. KR7-65 TaxID=3156612 RepID=UPI0032B5EF13